MLELPSLTIEEELGRAVWDSKKAKQATAGKVHFRVFRERDGVRDLSVDRLSYGGLDSLAKLHDLERSPQMFQGWAIVSVEHACQLNRAVKPDAIVPENIYHALIILPDATDEQEFIDAQTQHALNLAMAAHWQPRPQETLKK